MKQYIETILKSDAIWIMSNVISGSVLVSGVVYLLSRCWMQEGAIMKATTLVLLVISCYVLMYLAPLGRAVNTEFQKLNNAMTETVSYEDINKQRSVHTCRIHALVLANASTAETRGSQIPN